MKKNYQSPITSSIKVETGILCASGAMMAPAGTLQSISKGTGSW